MWKRYVLSKFKTTTLCIICVAALLVLLKIQNGGITSIFFILSPEHIYGNNLSTVLLNKYKAITNETFEDYHKKQNVLLFIGVLSSYQYLHRRKACRETWLRICSHHKQCLYKFFVDALDINKKPLEYSIINILHEESQSNNNDIQLLKTPIGRNFAIRIYKGLEYALKKINFKYFLRIDDDQYLCINRLMFELPYRPLKSLFWGYAHCDKIPTIDEGFMIISNDLAHNILNNSKLLCSPFGTNAVSSWVYDLMQRNHSITWYTDNNRILHTPAVEHTRTLRQRREICHTYITLHGIWKIQTMKTFHQIMLREANSSFNVTALNNVCRWKKKHVSLTELHVLGKPKPCKGIPVYTFNQGKPYIGREKNV